MAKDNIGNDLKVGDKIAIKPSDLVLLDIIKISEGGLLVAGKELPGNQGMMMAGTITCSAVFNLNVDPRTGLVMGICLKLAQQDKLKES